MKHALILAAALTMGMMSPAFAAGTTCLNPLNILIDPVVGVWTGTISIPELGYIGPVNFSIHAGGTLNGQGVQCIGVPLAAPNGHLFTVDTGAWKQVGATTYKVMYTDIGAEPTSIQGGTQGVLPTKTIGRTGFFGTMQLTSCKTLTMKGKIGIYGNSVVDDPTLSSPATIGPFDATLKLSLVGLR